eukprot:GHVT01036205.1.p1 GENE.GHVT01036205.1~~GHVT01036205.1.p1  ORF type:complete len:111 (-),score=13.17 GHVT01036205.1:10-342(-)
MNLALKKGADPDGWPLPYARSFGLLADPKAWLPPPRRPVSTGRVLALPPPPAVAALASCVAAVMAADRPAGLRCRPWPSLPPWHRVGKKQGGSEKYFKSRGYAICAAALM